MEGFLNFLSGISEGFLGGILSGGAIVAWIEFMRWQQEKKRWQDNDKKINLQVACAEATVVRWNPSATNNEKEKLRIYEYKLNGKLKRWIYLVKITLENLTESELLILSVNLDIPQPTILLAEDTKGMKQIVCGAQRYDLLKKNIISSTDLPLVLPAKSKSGVVFVGYYEFDYPQLVDEAPEVANFTTRLDDGSIHKCELFFDPTKVISEVDWLEDGEDCMLHWTPYMDANNIEYGYPF